MASALVHMNCPQLKNDIIVMESNSFNESLQEIARVKRDHDLHELDRCQVKKRRKQSKPNRITSTEQCSDNEIKSNLWISLPYQNHEKDLIKDQLPNHESIYCENLQENKNIIHNDKKIFDSDAEGSSEDMCSGLYNSDIKKEPLFPLNLSHKTPSPQGSVDSLSSNLDERGWYKTDNASVHYNMHNSDSKSQSFQNVFPSSQTCSPILPNFKRIMVGNSESQISSPHRIFNPEAFCDLCNKEFCNKYFLKTHKANKHGIYIENIGPNSMENLSTLPLMNLFSNNIGILTIPNNQPNKKINTNFTNNIANNITNKTNSNMRAFCNICQREFCNKYFVRRHKAKIHGIIEGNGDSLDFKPQMSNETLNGYNETTNLPGTSAVKGNNEIQSGKDSYEQIEEEKPYLKREENDSEDTNSPHDALSLLVSTWQNEDSKERSKSPERPKKASIINSAFCDICCKEYCNKYFLRIHKQKCHGVINMEKDERLKDPNSTYCNSNQPMPLNLTLREMNRDQNETNNVSCNICKLYFPDNCSMKIHNDQAHKNSTSDFSLEPDIKPQESKDQQQNTYLDSNFQKQNIENVTITNNLQENEKHNVNADVKKLNSVLLKLNQQTNFDNGLCDLCNQDYGNMSSLENHIIKHHSVLIEEINSSFVDGSNSSQITNKFECSKCQQTFTSLALLDQHFSEKHTLCESKNIVKPCTDNQDTSQVNLVNERPMAHTPTSSFCEICKKELCNKYFMKTHMQRMHGISIENGAHIGGVVCDICNKELCSKYFLRVHKQNSHGIIEETFLPQIGSEMKTSVSSNIDLTSKPNELELNVKYYTHFSEICTICSRRFRNTKWLKAHLLNDHGDDGKDKLKENQSQCANKNIERATDSTKKYEPYYNQFLKNLMNENISIENAPSTSESNNELSFLNRSLSKQYQCSYCPFITPALTLLVVHERSHIPQMTEIQDFRCPICTVLCESNEALDKHLSSQHQTNFSYKKKYDEAMQFSENSPMFHFEEVDSKRSETRVDNNYDEINDSKITTSPRDEVCLKCNQCSYVTPHVEMYSEHIKKEHNLEPQTDYLQIIRDALLQIANNSHIPASFAVPHNLGNFLMQPFVLEDKAYGANTCNTFLSSLVFLPVKERLHKPITASFKLTPT